MSCSANSGGFSGSGFGGSPASGGSSASLGTTSNGTTGGVIGLDVGGAASAVAAVAPSVWPPSQCVTAPVEGALGAYCLGPQVAAADATPANDNASVAAGCGTTLWGVVRDFISYKATLTFTSPDFGNYCCNVQTGMVANDLGADDKPVFTGVGVSSNPPLMTDKAHFDQWYNDVTDVNIPFYVAFRLDNDGSGTYTFAAADGSHQYFPLDGYGWGNDQYSPHNYSFTTEIHTQFVYQGGEIFKFTGDDDLWVFINRKLAIDIGGVHVATTVPINLDEHKADLGLVVGGVYHLDLFGAERHPSESNFRIDTSMKFVNCGAQPPIQ